MASIQRIGFTRYQNDLSKIFKALGHPARFALIQLLIGNEKLICKELAFELKLTAASATHHLQILMESGLIGYNKVGNMTYYVVNPVLIDSTKDSLCAISEEANKQSVNFSETIFAQQPMPSSF